MAFAKSLPIPYHRSKSNILLYDNFDAAATDLTKWTVVNPDAVFTQNNGMIITLPHAGVIPEFQNKIQSIINIPAGIAVVQGFLQWLYNNLNEPIIGIYLYKDNNNYASVTARATVDGGNLRLRIITGGVSRYSLDVASIYEKGEAVKIWTDGVDIKFYRFLNGVWGQMGVTQTWALTYPLYYVISCQDNPVFAGGSPAYVLDCYMYNKTLNFNPRYGNNEVLQSASAYCWFAKPKAVYSGAALKTWIGVMHKDNSSALPTQHIVELTNATGVFTTTRVGAVYVQDDHNEPTILIRQSDNRLFICYSEHGTSNNVRYRLSTNPLSAAAFAAESIFVAPDTVTYPSCFEGVTVGNIYIFYRESTIPNGWCYIKSTDDGATFGGRVNFFFGSATIGYLTFYQSPVNPDLIYMIASSGHPIDAQAISVYTFYFDMSTDTFHKLDGTDITAFLPLVEAGGHMDLIMQNVLPDTGWIEDIIVDAAGNPRYLFTFFPNGHGTNFLTKELWYCEFDGVVLSAPYKIHTALVRNFTLFVGAECYPPLSCFDRANPDRIFAAKEIEGVTEIFELNRITSNNFTSVRRTKDHYFDQWRPFTVTAPVRNVLWLNKMFYASWLSYDQQVCMKTL